MLRFWISSVIWPAAPPLCWVVCIPRIWEKLTAHLTATHKTFFCTTNWAIVLVLITLPEILALSPNHREVGGEKKPRSFDGFAQLTAIRLFCNRRLLKTRMSGAASRLESTSFLFASTPASFNIFLFCGFVSLFLSPLTVSLLIFDICQRSPRVLRFIELLLQCPLSFL